MESPLENWNRFVREGTKEYDGSNVRYGFTKMTKLFGRGYLDYLKAAYEAKDEMSDQEFCEINGGVPESFLRRKLRVNPR